MNAVESQFSFSFRRRRGRSRLGSTVAFAGRAVRRRRCIAVDDVDVDRQDESAEEKARPERLAQQRGVERADASAVAVAFFAQPLAGLTLTDRTSR